MRDTANTGRHNEVSDKDKRRHLLSPLQDVIAHSAIAFAVLAMFWGVNLLILGLKTSDFQLVLVRISEFAKMALVTTFCLSAGADIAVKVLHWVKKIQFRWIARKEAFSYIFGVIGFSVVYALMHRALEASFWLPKLLIYTGGFILAIEIIYVLTRTFKRRVVFPAIEGSSAVHSY